MLPVFLPPPPMMLNGLSPARFSPRNALPPPSPPSPVPHLASKAPPRLDLDSLSDHLLDGFTSSYFTDVVLHLDFAKSTEKQTFNLHAIVISRSPTLRRILEKHPKLPREYSIPLLDPFITSPAIATSLASLYCPSQSVLAEVSLHAPGVLAAASFLGLDELAALAADSCEEIIKRSKKPAEFLSHFRFLKGAAEAFNASDKASIYGPGIASPVTNSHHASPNISTSPSSATPAYGVQGARLWKALLTRIFELPKVYGLVEDGADFDRGHERMVQLFCVCPFAVVKNTLESSKMCCPGGDMGRYKLAKAAITARKGRVLIEENVVLAFSDSADRPPVVVLQKTAPRPPLWKVGG